MSFKEYFEKLNKSYLPESNISTNSTNKNVSQTRYTDYADSKVNAYAIMFYDAKLHETEDATRAYEEFLDIPNKHLYFNGCKQIRFIQDRLRNFGVDLSETMKNELVHINNACNLYRKFSVNSADDFLKANIGGNAMAFMEYTELMLRYKDCKTMIDIENCILREREIMEKIELSRNARKEQEMSE